MEREAALVEAKEEIHHDPVQVLPQVFGKPCARERSLRALYPVPRLWSHGVPGFRQAGRESQASQDRAADTVIRVLIADDSIADLKTWLFKTLTNTFINQ